MEEEDIGQVAPWSQIYLGLSPSSWVIDPFLTDDLFLWLLIDYTLAHGYLTYNPSSNIWMNEYTYFHAYAVLDTNW